MVKKKEKISSRPGLFGTVNHYDSKGKKIGESRPGLFGTTNHYDSKGKKVGSSQKGGFGRSVHYDSKGHKTGTSYSSIFGTDHYDAKGRSAGHTNRIGFGTRQSSFGENGSYTMIDRDDRRNHNETITQSNDSINEQYATGNFKTQNSAERSNNRQASGLTTGDLLLIIVLWFTSLIALLNFVSIFAIGACDVFGMIVCGVASVPLWTYLRNKRKKNQED